MNKRAAPDAKGLRMALVHHQRIKGGAEVSLELLVHMLHAKGITDMLLICPKGWLSDSLKDMCRVKHVPMPESARPRSAAEWGIYGFKLLVVWYRMLRVLKANNINLVYCNSIPARLFAWLPCLALKIRVIWHVRDVRFPRKLVRTLLHSTDLVIAVSEFVHDRVPQVRKADRELLYNALDPDFWEPMPPTGFCHNRFRLPFNCQLVVTVGHLVPWKEHDLFFEMAEILAPSFPNVHFILIGDPPVKDRFNCQEQLQERIGNSDWKSQLHIFPQMPDLRPLFAEMSVFVHPASEEPFGRVLIEAMAMERAVVTVNSGGVKEIVENEVTGYLVEPRDARQLAEKVSDILLDPGLALRLGQAGRRRVKDRFGLDRQKEGLEGIIKHILNDKVTASTSKSAK